MLLKPFDHLVVGVDTIRVCLGWIALNVEVVVGAGERGFIPNGNRK